MSFFLLKYKCLKNIDGFLYCLYAAEGGIEGDR